MSIAGSVLLGGLLLFAPSTTTSAAAPLECGDFDANGSLTASDALALLRATVGIDVTLICPGCEDQAGANSAGTAAAGTGRGSNRAVPLICGDVDGDGALVASDALLLLQATVDLPVTPLCPACVATTTSTTTTTTLSAGETVDCAAGLIPSDETCTVVPGGSSLLVQGDILAPATVFVGGGVLVDATGKITCVGCDCAASAGEATQVVCPDAVISPALINLHEHLTFSSGAPAPDTGERYDDRHQWRTGKDGHNQLSIGTSATTARRQWTELRHVLAATLSIAGSGSVGGLVRNLDRGEPDQEGLNLANTVNLDTFPLGDSRGDRLAEGCDYPSLTTREELLDEDASLLHVAQGVNHFAANEIRCLTSSLNGGEDLALPTTSFVDAIALDPANMVVLAEGGSGVIWSPRMHLRVYGATTPATLAAKAGVPIGMGTGTAALGSQNMLRELACADEYNTNYLDGFFSDRELWQMATSTGADLTATDGLIGRLEVDAFADLAVFAKSGREAHRAVLAAEPDDVSLVLRAGTPLYGDALLIPELTDANCDVLDVCGTSKRACVLDELGKSFATLSSEVGEGAEPLATCSPVVDEPTCVPSRPISVNGSSIYDGQSTAQDGDGDGIPTVDDLCPTVFDPILPFHDGAQADADEDELGDACDPCPLSGECPQ